MGGPFRCEGVFWPLNGNCALKALNPPQPESQSQNSPFCGSFAKSLASWQRNIGTPLRSNCFIRIPRHRHSARAPVPRHGNQVVEPAALVTGIGSHTDATAVRQVDDQNLMAGSATRRLQQTHGAVLKQVEVTIDFENVELPDISEIVLAIDRAGPGVRPHSVADLIALNDVDAVRKIRHAASMIEV